MDMQFLLQKPIAHRGLHGGNAPENSMAAFHAAIACGYPIEMDVRLSKDGQPIVFHDATLERMTGARLNAFDCTAQELSLLRLAGTQEHIPLFSDFLREVDGRVPLLIEIKNMEGVNTKEYVGLVERALRDYHGAFAMQSFQPVYMKAFKKLRPDVPVGILAAAKTTKADFNNSPIWRIKAMAVRNMSFNRSVKPDFISYCFSDYPQKCTEKFKGHKLAWTVCSPTDEAYARKYAENIIFQDYIPKES